MAVVVALSSKRAALPVAQKPTPACFNSVKPGVRVRLVAKTSLGHAVHRRRLVCKAVVSTNNTTQTANTSENGVYTTVDKNTKNTPRVVILGSGWGGMSVIKALPKDISSKYEVVIVSPRNYFLYTPLLPAVATGTVEERSIVEPVRNLVVGKGDYYEAVCKDIDPYKKELVCCFPADAGLDQACFKISYDYLVVSVGSVNNTFGIKGVKEHCFFFKSIEDANQLRRRVSECFERAALPMTPDEEKKKLLSFVVCGGGPTGVEVAAELYDMIYDDLSKLYPALMKDVQIQLVELMDFVLSTYDRAIAVYATEQFKRAGIKLILNTRVAAVEDGIVQVMSKSGEASEIKFGACVWATGIAMHPLIKQIQEKVPGQTHFRSVVTDEALRVKGVPDGSIFAIGDAATIDQPKALEFVDQLFDQADTNRDGKLSLAELRAMLKEASTRFSHLEEHATFLDGLSGITRWGNLVLNTIKKEDASKPVSPVAALTDETQLSHEEFTELIKKIDSGLRALPATAQVARQQAEFIAKLMSVGRMVQSPDGNGSGVGTLATPPAFKYNHKGSLAYIGGDKAVMDVPRLGAVTGYGAGLLWKGFETYSQISFRNKCLVGLDWARTKLFGRDISRV